MAQVRIDIDLNKEGYVVTSSAELVGWKASPRKLRRGAPHGYPLPPLVESAGWIDPNSAVLWTDGDDTKLRELNDLVLGDPVDGDVERFGDYLFATLLGPVWEEMERCDAVGGHSVQIAVSEGASLAHSLPWEMMCRQGQPLIAQIRPHSVSRLVRPAQPPAPGQFELPLRVLFVVGKADPALRPGAEYLGILRGLGDPGASNGRLSPILNVRSLAEADTERIEAAVVSFRPHIVHIVAHGIANGEEPTIQLTKNTATGSTVSPCSAERLLEALKGGSHGKVPLPPLVLINACYSANQPAQGNARSFAAALAYGGVAAVIGMAGEVASSACRLFTKAFYRALASQLPVEQAVARGQYAARLHYEKYKRSVEWGRPALFLAAGAQLTFSVNDGQKALITAAARQRGRPTIMCDRTAALRAYQQFIESTAPDRPTILAFEQASEGEAYPITESYSLPYKLGKTMLLSELSWHAILDGFLPCFVQSSQATPPPNNLALFALRLVDVMDRMRESFDVARRHTAAVQRWVFLRLGKGNVEYDPQRPEVFLDALAEVKHQLESRAGLGIDGVDARMFGTLLGSDLKTFCDDVRAKCPCVRGALIMIDDLHRYEGYYAHVLELVNEFGLGVAEAPAPLVITYTPRRAGETGAGLEPLLKSQTSAIAKRTLVARLEPFGDDLEGRAAYLQYLLKKQLAPSRGLGAPAREALDATLDAIHAEVRGVPSFLSLADLQVGVAKRYRALVPVDDEAIFALMERNGYG